MMIKGQPALFWAGALFERVTPLKYTATYKECEVFFLLKAVIPIGTTIENLQTSSVSV